MTPGPDVSLREGLLRTAVVACRRAGELLRGRGAAPATSRAKSADHDRVTEYDLRAEQLIRQTILADHPGTVVIGEEAGLTTGDPAVCWYVDPIDGTNNFANGLPLYCVSIGVAIEGRIEVGCVFDPVRQEAFTAGPRGLAVNGLPVRPRSAPHAPPVLLTDFPLGGTTASPVQLLLLGDLLRGHDVRRLGTSALALAYVAAGRADLACNVATHSWDVAAGIALVAAAGGRYYPLNRPTDPPGTVQDAWGFVACRNGEASALVDRLREAAG